MPATDPECGSTVPPLPDHNLLIPVPSSDSVSVSRSLLVDYSSIPAFWMTYFRGLPYGVDKGVLTIAMRY